MRNNYCAEVPLTRNGQSLRMDRETMSVHKSAQGKTYNFLFKMYTFTGFWKLESNDKWKRYFYDVYVLIMWVWLSSWFVLITIDAFLKCQNLKLLVNNLCCTVMVALLFFKLSILTKKMDDADMIRKNLANSWGMPNIGDSEEDLEILIKAEQEINLILRMIMGLGSLSITVWSFIPFLDHSSDERILPLPFPEIFELKERPTYEFLYVYDMISLLHCLLIIVAYDFIYCGFLNQICAQFDILGKNFKKMERLYTDSGYGSVLEDAFEQKRIGNRKGGMGRCVTHLSKVQKTKETMKMLLANIRHHQAIIR